MWAGPYGEWGSRKYLLASLDQYALCVWGSDYVDIFYSHRFFRPRHSCSRRQRAPWTQPCARARRCTRASRPIRRRRREAYDSLAALGTSLLIHQPSYSLLNRWIEPELLDTLGELGVGCICFSPLAQGMLTAKYLDGIPADSRAARDGSLSPELLTDETLGKIRALNQVAARRGQSLAQLALAWTLRDPRTTSTLVGSSSVLSARGLASARSTTSNSPTTSSRRSTITPRRAASTSRRAHRRSRAIVSVRRSPELAAPANLEDRAGGRLVGIPGLVHRAHKERVPAERQPRPHRLR